MQNDGASFAGVGSLRSREVGGAQMIPKIEQVQDDGDMDGDMDGGNRNPTETSFVTISKQDRQFYLLQSQS